MTKKRLAILGSTGSIGTQALEVVLEQNDRFEVEVHGDDFLILRERDVHAIAAPRVEPGSTGLYL